MLNIQLKLMFKLLLYIIVVHQKQIDKNLQGFLLRDLFSSNVN
jgi:hypothetical protein